MTTVLWYSNGNHDFTASNAWNQAADGSGTAGNPDADDRVLIQSGDTVTLDNNVTVGTCAISGTFTGNTSYSLTLAGSSEDFNYSNSGTVTNLNIIMTGLRASGDRSMIDIGSGIRDLTINDATNSGNNVHHIASNLSISGDLTITEGTLNTGHAGTDRALTVTGNIDVDGGNLNVNDSAVSCAKLIVESGDTITAAHSSNALTVTGAGIGNARSIDFTGAISGTLDIITTHSGTREDDLSASSGTVNHLTVNNGSAVMRMNASYTIGTLTISAGQFSTADGGGNSKDLTVTGGIRCIGGTFTGNASTVAIGFLEINAGGTFNAPNASGSLTINNKDTTTDNRAFDNDATFNHNSGTVTITTASSTGLDLTGTGGTGINNLVINHASCTGNFEGAISLAGDLTITAGTFKANTPASDTLTVAGDVIVTGTLGNANLAHDQNYSFGSLTINSGGTYNATSGTTTITSEPSSGFNLSNSGTFTHNKGTVKVTCATQTTLTGFSGSNAFFNFTYAGTGSGQDQICGANTDFFGQVVIDSANSELQMQQHTFNLYDGIRIKQGGWDIGSSSTSGTINVYGAVRNVGGTVVAS